LVVLDDRDASVWAETRSFSRGRRLAPKSAKPPIPVASRLRRLGPWRLVAARLNDDRNARRRGAAVQQRPNRERAAIVRRGRDQPPQSSSRKPKPGLWRIVQNVGRRDAQPA